MNKLLVQGGAGGSAVWRRSKTSSVLMKIGGSRKFNSNDRIVDYHSRAPASIHTRDEEAIAVLAHNLSSEPFDDQDIIRELTALGLVPAPIMGDDDDDEITDPESEEEELFPLGLGPCHKGIGTKHFDNRLWQFDKTKTDVLTNHSRDQTRHSGGGVSYSSQAEG